MMQPKQNTHSIVWTDPFADLSVDEDKVVQGQDYLARATVTIAAKGEPNPAGFPKQS